MQFTASERSNHNQSSWFSSNKGLAQVSTQWWGRQRHGLILRPFRPVPLAMTSRCGYYKHKRFHGGKAVWKGGKKFPNLVQRCRQWGFRLSIRNNLCNSGQAPSLSWELTGFPQMEAHGWEGLCLGSGMCDLIKGLKWELLLSAQTE